MSWRRKLKDSKKIMINICIDCCSNNTLQRFVYFGVGIHWCCCWYSLIRQSPAHMIGVDFGHFYRFDFSCIHKSRLFSESIESIKINANTRTTIFDLTTLLFEMQCVFFPFPTSTSKLCVGFQLSRSLSLRLNRHIFFLA